MKIQCQSCQAKYTIADEKVLGKVVKIRCKKCSSTIVINGNEQPAAEGSGAGAFDYSQSNDQWTVNVADGDQRTLTVSEISTEYRNGVVNDETYCWKDGMADWLPLREIDSIFSAVKGSGRMADEVSVTPQSVPPPQAAPLFAGGGSGGESPFAGAHANGNGTGALFAGGSAEQHAPAAARRAGGRAQGQDLFGNVEKAGGEDDVMTSAATGGGAAAAAAAAPAGEKLTGQRNENSVLFSLSALTEKTKETAASSTNRTTATSDGSGLIDIRALSANMDEGEKSKEKGAARVDDIMNLSGGGAFGAALAAPILAPPPLEAVDLGVSAAEAPQQNKTLVFAILGGCAFIAVGIIVAVVLTRSPAATADTKNPSVDTSAAAPGGSTMPGGAIAQNDPSSAPTGAATGGGDTPPPPGTGQSTPSKGVVAAPRGNAPAPRKAGGGGGGDNASPAPAPPPPSPAAPKDLSGALAEAAGKKDDKPSAPSGGGSTAAFDRGAAAAALGAVNVASCKKSDGPSGSGHVTVTFGPDGSVQSAVVDGGNFPGTSVGGCIAGKYRGAHVPAFGGAPVRVGKSFTVN